MYLDQIGKYPEIPGFFLMGHVWPHYKSEKHQKHKPYYLMSISLMIWIAFLDVTETLTNETHGSIRLVCNFVSKHILFLLQKKILGWKFALLTMEDNPNYFQVPFATAFYQKACGLSQLRQSILQTVVSQVDSDVFYFLCHNWWFLMLFITDNIMYIHLLAVIFHVYTSYCCPIWCVYIPFLSILMSHHCLWFRWFQHHQQW